MYKEKGSIYSVSISLQQVKCYDGVEETKDQTRMVLEFFPLKQLSLSLSLRSLDLIPQEDVCQIHQHRCFFENLIFGDSIINIYECRSFDRR